MEPLLLSLLESLETIAKKHDELFDSEVRTEIGDAVFLGFLRQVEGYHIPDEFGLHTKEGNRAVKKALEAFVASATVKAKELGLTDFHSRLIAFQDSNVCTENDENYHDDFFGWWNPEDFDALGNVKKPIENKAKTAAEHIHELINNGTVRLLPIQISRDFGRFLESCPLLMPLGASIDWSRVPNHSSVEWYEKSDEELIQWARGLRIGKCSHVAMWYSSNEQCLLASFEFGIANIDVLTWKAPGPRYMFGVELEGDLFHCGFHAFLEVTGGRLLIGVT